MNALKRSFTGKEERKGVFHVAKLVAGRKPRSNRVRGKGGEYYIQGRHGKSKSKNTKAGGGGVKRYLTLARGVKMGWNGKG